MKFVTFINKSMETIVFVIIIVVLMGIALFIGKGNPKSDGIHQFSYYSGDKFTILTDYSEEKIKGWILGGGIKCMIEAECNESELPEVRKKERERILEIVRKMNLARQIK
jgi:hypothetical protein